MNTSQSIRIRLIFNSLHKSFIKQRLDAWITAYNRSSPYPDLDTPHFASSIDLIQATLDNPTTNLPYYDNYNCLVSIIQNASPHRLILTISLPLSNKFDPCHQIISHSSQPVTISETILTIPN